jgi:hypothetical protein
MPRTLSYDLVVDIGGSYHRLGALASGLAAWPPHRDRPSGRPGSKIVAAMNRVGLVFSLK